MPGRCPGHHPFSVGLKLLPISFPSGLLLWLWNIPERGEQARQGRALPTACGEAAFGPRGLRGGGPCQPGRSQCSSSP